MGIAAVVAIVGAATYTAYEQRQAAKDQAAAMAEQARRAAAQAAESARADALAAQTAQQREQSQAAAKASVELAQQENTAPTVELATANPNEAARRRTVRATFNPDDNTPDAGTSIRL